MSSMQLPKNPRKFLLLIVCGSALILACFCVFFLLAAGREPATKNFILIGIDALRADHVSCYQYNRGTTPTIDKLAQTGFAFSNCTTVSPWTLPSFFSTMTSTYPSTHLYGTNIRGFANPALGVAKHWTIGTISPDYEIKTLGETLRAHGYYTAAFVNNPFLMEQYEMNRGFDEYKHYEPSAIEATKQILPWLDRHKEDKFFLFIHLMDPHDYFIERAPINKILQDFGVQQDNGIQMMINKYDASIYLCDREIGLMLERLAQLGLEGNTAVVVTADHGEELFDHGGIGHGQSLYSEVLSVPLIFHVPWRKTAGKMLAERVATIDIAPTILEILGLAIPQYYSGRSLLPLLDGKSLPERPVFAEAILYGDEKKAVIFNNRKLIYTTMRNEFQMYDMEHDRRDEKNLIGEDPASELQMKQMLQSHLMQSERQTCFALKAHLELPSLEGKLTTTGIFRNVMPLDILKSQTFEVNETRQEIRFTMGAGNTDEGIIFMVEPPDASIRLDIARESNHPPIGVYLGSSHENAKLPPVAFDEKILRALDAPEPGSEKSGIYIWLKGAGTQSKPIVINEAAKDKLETLGYLK